MIVKIDIPPKVLWALSERAEREGVTVGDLLVSAATDPPPMPVSIPTTETTHDRVRRLWSEGACDADIAAALHMSSHRVAKVRQGMKLPANRRFKPEAQAARLAARNQAEKRSA